MNIAPSLPVVPDYDILALAGRGAFGSVWVARDRTGILHALKVVDVSRLPDHGSDHREEEALCLVRQRVPEHPHLVRISHVSRQEKQLVYAMELADPAPSSPPPDQPGYQPDTLSQRLAVYGRLPVADAIRLALDLLSAVEALHAAKLVHRDVKPQNVIFVKGVPKLADVGLTAVDRPSLSVAGTPGYLPLDGSIGPDADLYAVGKVLYQSITGLEPANFPSIPAVLFIGLEKLLIWRLNRVLLQACAPTRAERFASAGELRAALEQVLSPAPLVSVKWVVPCAALLFALGIGVWALAMRGRSPSVSTSQQEEPMPATTVEEVLSTLTDAPVDDDFIRAVRALPAEEQVRAVTRKMKKLNPDLAEQIKMSVQDGKVVGVTVSPHQVSDLSPLRALPDLQALDCSSEADYHRGRITDLSCLHGMRLARLQFAGNKVMDLSPLKGMPLEQLDCSANTIGSLEPLRGTSLKILLCHINRIKDLSPVAELPLVILNCGANPIEEWSPLARLPLQQLFVTYSSFRDFSILKAAKLEVVRFEKSQVTDLGPLAGMPLFYLDCDNCKVTTLEPLRKAPLRFLSIRGTQVQDLSPLAGKYLEEIGLTGSKVRDLTPLKGMPISVIDLDFDAERDGPILRTLPRLRTVNRRPKDELLKPN